MVPCLKTEFTYVSYTFYTCSPKVILYNSFSALAFRMQPVTRSGVEVPLRDVMRAFRKSQILGHFWFQNCESDRLGACLVTASVPATQLRQEHPLYPLEVDGGQLWARDWVSC